MNIADKTDDEKEVEDKSDPWAPLRTETAEKSLTEFEELWQNFSADDLEENEAKDEAYLIILPKFRKHLQHVYLDRQPWIAQIDKDTIHKRILRTKDAFVNDVNFDPEEA